MSERRIVVHSLDQARAAVAAAVVLNVPLTLASAPGAGGYAGPGWFKALAAAAAADHPALDITTVIDCGDEAGTVLAALRLGFSRIRFAGNEAARARLGAIASSLGATLETAAPDGDDILDLRDCRDPEEACRAFLGRAGTADRPCR